MRHLIIILLAIFAFLKTPEAQNDLANRLSGYVNPDELVTLSQNIPFDQAVGVISKVSEKLTGKKIVSLAGINTPIGITIEQMPYKRALKIITQYNNLVFEERQDVTVIKKLSDDTADLSQEIYASIDEREVKITAVFFEANVLDMRERGINWQFVFAKSGITIGTDMTTFGTSSSAENPLFNVGGTTTTSTTASAATEKPPDFQVGTQTHFEMGDFVGDALGIFKFFESENLGEIISKPSISVRNKTQGKIQIGSDISIKQRDFAGNIIEQFHPTGTIIEVTPYLYSEDNINYVLLKLNLERSSAQVDAVTTEIAKTMANTDILLLDGEETVIGGLYINEEVNVRRGVPILKDLPWWFFGLRYIFGYESTQIQKKEVIILIKADILPTLKERINIKKTRLIEQQFRKDEEELKNYKIDKLHDSLKKRIEAEETEMDEDLE